jgi:hypothetical protein
LFPPNRYWEEDRSLSREEVNERVELFEEILRTRKGKESG